jgi:murein DD-endopeptidase MepM/ murein hydrolase activator NlpD
MNVWRSMRSVALGGMFAMTAVVAAPRSASAEACTCGCGMAVCTMANCKAKSAAKPTTVQVPNPVAGSNGRLNPVDPTVGQGAGYYGAPRDGNRPHTGIDVPAPVGTPVQSTSGGIVTQSIVAPTSSTAATPLPTVDPRLYNGAGSRVTVQGANGMTHQYWHLNGANQPAVGSRVVPGQVIGGVGTSGNTPPNAAPHLHYQTQYRGTPVQPVIPRYAAPRYPQR